MERENRQSAHRQSGREKRRGSVVGKIFFGLFTLLLIGVLTSGMIAVIFMKYVETNITPVVQVNADDYTMNLSSIVYYHDDQVTANDGWVEYQTIHGTENRVWVDIDEMPDALWQAVVAIEDQRFFQHNGVDWKRTGGAVLNMFIGMKNTFGGSTITQQVLKNMTEDNSGTVNRKVREIFRALEFEKNYTKAQILELYLNTIYLGQGCYGVQTAAQYYFGKDVSELSVAECASLIAITNNPSLYGPMYDVTYTREDGTTVTPRELNKQRQTNILDKMCDAEDEGIVGPATLSEMGSDPGTWTAFLTKEEADAAKAEVLQFTDGTTSADDIAAAASGGIKINNWFVDQVIWDVSKDLAREMEISEKEARILINNSGYRIYTTMDLRIQEIAESVYEDRSNLDLTSRDGQPIRSGITIIDPYTGNVVATVGDLGEKEGNLLTSYAMDRRQPGSSIKPLTAYAPAIDSGKVTPATTFDDYPVQLLNDNPWPKNSPNKYRGWTTVRTGIQHSINTIAVQTLQTVGVADAYAFATENLNLSLVPDDMGLSPLGMGGLTYGLNTREMAAAYASFANMGVYNSPRTYLRVEDANGNVILENEGESHAAMKETTAYLMNEMLKNAVNAGTGTSAKFGGMTIAGKTGTTSDNYDRYFVGYTPYYVAAVWTGYKYNAKISYSGNPAITLWKKVMQQVHEGLENKNFQKPSSGLETITVCADSGLLCSDACHADLRGDRAITMTVAKDTGPTETCTMHVFRDYCTEGKCLATATCPMETVTQVGVLDHVRENYGPSITAEDDAYTVQKMEQAIGLQPTIAEDGSEVYPDIVGCPVHVGGFVDPDLPIVGPDDPNYIPPSSGGEDPETPTPPVEPPPTTPTPPTEPEVPAEPEDPTGGVDWSVG